MKPAKLYYSAPVNHPDLPGAFYCSFGIVGHPPEWVMDRGQRKVFGTKEEAEIAGYRSMMQRMNRVNGEQKAVMRGVRVSRPEERPAFRQRGAQSDDISRVFARFGARKTDDLKSVRGMNATFTKSTGVLKQKSGHAIDTMVVTNS